jgi:hypothetical protein
LILCSCVVWRGGYTGRRAACWHLRGIVSSTPAHGRTWVEPYQLSSCLLLRETVSLSIMGAPANFRHWERLTTLSKCEQSPVDAVRKQAVPVIDLIFWGRVAPYLIAGCTEESSSICTNCLTRSNAFAQLVTTTRGDTL